MADRTKEEILAEHEARVIACAEATRLYGQNGSAEFGASEMSCAAVLARMAGPNEVVVPKEPTYHDLLAMSIASGASLDQLTKAWRVFIAAARREAAD